MEDTDKIQNFNITMSGITINGPMFDIHDNGVINNYFTTQPPKEGNIAASSRITDKQLAHAIEACSDLFWAQSAWGVIYCVCRDYLGMNYNMAEFERYVNDRLPFAVPPSYLCPEETISKAIRTSKYMELHIDKWEGNGAKERVLKLKEKLITELNQE